jgi:hypothetical protein
MKFAFLSLLPLPANATIMARCMALHGLVCEAAAKKAGQAILIKPVKLSL